jgi:hypothetical protein
MSIPEVTLTFPKGHHVQKVSTSHPLPPTRCRSCQTTKKPPVAFKTGLYINNEFVASESGKTIVSICSEFRQHPELTVIHTGHNQSSNWRSTGIILRSKRKSTLLPLKSSFGLELTSAPKDVDVAV